VTDRRTPPRFFRRGLLAAAVVCALAGPAAADPIPSRDYPPTYSSKAKAPWYDPLRLVTSSETKTDQPAPPHSSRPIPNDVVDRSFGAAPAWKWYGYGTPTPGRNPLAPNGTYGPVPANWYTTSGTTPGAIPHGRPVPGFVPDPVPAPMAPMGPATSIAVVPPEGPTLLAPVAPPSTTAAKNVDWKSAPARLRVPVAHTLVNDGPRAKLGAPVHDDPPVPPPPRTSAPATPLERELPATDSREVPVESAPGIVIPSGGMSRLDGPVTARGLAPAADLPAAVIRKACGRDVRVMEVTAVGPKRMLVRLAATPDAAWAARDRLARLPELREWRVDFELVTPLRP
jgi:hypothetical protein